MSRDRTTPALLNRDNPATRAQAHDRQLAGGGELRLISSVDWAVAKAAETWQTYWATPGDAGQGARMKLMLAARVQTQCDQVTEETTDLGELVDHRWRSTSAGTT